MTKELFIETIEAIKKQRDHDAKCHDAFSVLLPNDYVSGYDHHWILNQITKLLQVSTGQNGPNCWIEYYMWECDFGRNDIADSVTIQGKPIPLRTSEDLWNLINRNEKEN